MADQVIEYLHFQWLRLTSAFTDKSMIETYFKALITAYSQQHRAYHKPEHLQHLIGLLYAANIADDAVLWASFYHDYVYEPGKNTNELKSAKIAEEQLRILGVDSKTIERVIGLILATQHHKLEDYDHNAALFLDADMAILGEGKKIYIDYMSSVRQEFIHLPQFLYKRGRRSFLHNLLKQKRIYSTDWFYDRFEKSARENITWELSQR